MFMPSNVPKSMDEIRDSVNTLIRYVSGSAHNSRSNSHHGSKAEKLDSDQNLSCHSMSEHLLSVSNHGIPLDTTAPEKTNELQRRNSSDSAKMVAKFSNIPLHVRGRAEKWELPRSQIQIGTKIGEGQGGVVYKCRWRSLDCAAKFLTQDSTDSIAYYDMVNEISIISHLRHPNLVLFLGACTVGNEPLLILSEFMEGGSLEDRFNGASGRPPIKLAFRWIMDLSRAVCFLHNCTTPIIHRSKKVMASGGSPFQLRVRAVPVSFTTPLPSSQLPSSPLSLPARASRAAMRGPSQGPQARQPAPDRRGPPQGASAATAPDRAKRPNRRRRMAGGD